MRVGCLGCLGLLVILLVVFLGGGAALYFAGGIFDTPPLPPFESPADGLRAQQKIYDLASRTPRGTERGAPVVFSERELNAFLTRHLQEAEGIPLSPVLVRLTPGRVDLIGQTSLQDLLKAFPLSYLPDYLPATALDRPVWVTLSGTVEVEGRRGRTERRQARFRVGEFTLGSQDLGPWILPLLLGGAERRLFRWPLPPAVESISVEEGRLVVNTLR